MISFHVDDYGYTLSTSKDIIECIREDRIDGVSIISNTSFFDDSMNLLYENIRYFKRLPKIVVHLNIVEGFAASQEFKYIAEKGILNRTWDYYFINSFSSKRSAIKKELKKEIKKQIDVVASVTQKCISVAKENNIPFSQKGIGIDSHMHTHPIPLVWECVKEVIEENNYPIEYIRNPKEPSFPFTMEFSLWRTYSCINYVKNIILNILSYKIDRYQEEKGFKKMYMCGLIMSGHMDFKRLSLLFSKLVKLADKRNRDIEFLFHPGRALKQEERIELSKENLELFNESKNRIIEKECLFLLEKN